MRQPKSYDNYSLWRLRVRRFQVHLFKPRIGSERRRNISTTESEQCPQQERESYSRRRSRPEVVAWTQQLEA